MRHDVPNLQDRTANSARNTAMALAGRIFVTVMGYVVRVVFTHTLSQVYVGVNGLFLDIINMLSLTELGIESAVTYALYKPIAEGDIELQKSIMRYYGRMYRVVALVVALLGLAVLPFLPRLIADYDALDNVTFIYLLYLANAVVSYLLVYKRTLIDAHQMLYITSLYHNGFLLLQYVLQIAVLVIARAFIPYLVVAIVCTIAGNYAMSRKAEALFPFLRDKDVQDFDSREIERNVKAMLLNKAGSVAINNTDNLVLSSYFGLAAVGIYSNYFLLIGSLRQMCNEVFLGMAASVGNLGVTADNARVRKILEAVLLAAAWAYGWAAICLFELLDPFISLSFGEQYVFGRPIVLVLCVNFFVLGLRSPSTIFHDSLGLFYYDRFKSLAEALVNLGLSLLLAWLLGPIGVFLGTLVATVTTSSWIEPWVIYRKRLDCSPAPYYRRMVLYVVVVATAWALTAGACSFIQGDPLMTLLLRFPVCMVLPCAVLFGALGRTDEFRLLWGKASRLVRSRLGGHRNEGE